MADKKKKSSSSKKPAKRAQSTKKTGKVAKAKKPTAKRPAAKTSPIKETKQAKSKTVAKKAKEVAPKSKAKKANKPKAPKDLKPDWDFENEVPKRGRGKKESININITPKGGAQKKGAKNVTKQVTNQLPDNAKLRTIHLHFRLD